MQTEPLAEDVSAAIHGKVIGKKLPMKEHIPVQEKDAQTGLLLVHM